jgi:predicted secreted protein
MSDGQHGHGSSLSIGGTTVGNIMSVSGPSEARDPIEISTMDSATKFREFIPGMLDAGEITMEINYDGADGGTANDLDTMLRATNTNYSVVVTFDDTSTFTSVGFVTALGHAIPYDDKISQSVSVKLTGVPTFTDVAA